MNKSFLAKWFTDLENRAENTQEKSLKILTREELKNSKISNFPTSLPFLINKSNIWFLYIKKWKENGA